MTVSDDQFFHVDLDTAGYMFTEDIPLTNDIAEQLDKIASAPLGKQAKMRAKMMANLKPGGKSLTGGRTHSPKFQVVLPEPIAANVRALSAADGVSVSKWLRQLVIREVTTTVNAKGPAVDK